LINLSFFKSIIYNGREGVKKNYVNQYQIQEKPALIFDSVVVYDSKVGLCIRKDVAGYYPE
jgi:hypothetical protein